jgi:hypothetical protein
MRSRRAIAAGILSILCASPAVRAQRVVSEEYRLKAAFVYRFPQFVEWPPEALANRKSIELCVVRPNPFGGALQELFAGELLNGRPFVIRDIDSHAPLDSCHVLFLPRLSASGASGPLARASGLPILTVGESEGFLDGGGVIRLRLVDRRVRFDVNTAAATRARLRLSSQLLDLALEVRGGTQ